jgi:hypothetical protein
MPAKRRRARAKREQSRSPSARPLSARRRMARRIGAVLLVGLILLLVLAVLLVRTCDGGGGGKGNKTGNLLANPGFEEGKEPWYSMETSGWGDPFEVSDAVAHSGQYSAHLSLRPPAQPNPHQVFGAVQSLTPSSFPELLSGFYRVENWKKGTEFQYIQFVVIAVLPGDAGNIQIRYLLGGAASEPFEIGNAKFVFVSKEEPLVGEWVHFERNIRDDFQQQWGEAPEDVQELRVFFEARYDTPTATQPEIGGDVYYDDLYVGSKAEAPAYP